MLDLVTGGSIFGPTLELLDPGLDSSLQNANTLTLPATGLATDGKARPARLLP